MLIPSMDIREGKVVQLRGGKDLALVCDRDPEELLRELNRYGTVSVIDLDAALGTGSNAELIARLCRVAPVRVGGGIRDEAAARRFLRAGATQVIIGTAADSSWLSTLPRERVLIAIDHRDQTVVDHGWTGQTAETIFERANRLAPFCGGFLCTWVEREGGLGGMPFEEVTQTLAKLPLPAIVAGGIADTSEAIRFCRAGVDVQVGMALYTGALDPADVVAGSVFFQADGLCPTVVQDEYGQVLMLAYSSEESLRRALKEGKGMYWSRSRNALWEKGATSGHAQRLLSVRTDCDRDALLFTVSQSGRACHAPTYSCFGTQSFSMPRLLGRLRGRIASERNDSYTFQLASDAETLSRKLMEEAFELTRAETSEEIVWESADVLYHLTVLLASRGIAWSDIEHELSGREKP